MTSTPLNLPLMYNITIFERIKCLWILILKTTIETRICTWKFHNTMMPNVAIRGGNSHNRDKWIVMLDRLAAQHNSTFIKGKTSSIQNLGIRVWIIDIF